MTIYLVVAEHFCQPGLILRAFHTMDGAKSEAVNLTNIMLKDDGKAPCTLADWQDALERLQDTHGAQYCYVDITPLEVLP